MTRYIRMTLIILAVLLVVLLIFFMVQYNTLRQQNAMTARALHWSLLLEHHAPLPTSEVGILRSWMTFDYVNKLFALPPDYLSMKLGIKDPHYPRLTISSYAKTDDASSTMFLLEIESAVQSYSSSTPANLAASST